MEELRMYVRWGHDECPSTAQLVYSGRAGGPNWNQAGGSNNPQCLPLDPNFLTPISGNQYWRGLIYGAEYETYTDSNSHVHGCQNTEWIYHVQFVTSVIVLQSTWFLLSTHALRDGPESIMAI